MKLGKKIAVFAILATTGLFASGVSNVNTLVNKINNTSNLEEREDFIRELDEEFARMDKHEVPAAQEIVRNKLKLSKVLEK